MEEQPQVATPGKRLGSTTTHKAGEGTYVRQNQIYASIVGKVELTQMKAPTQERTFELINVIPPRSKELPSRMVLQVDDVVICRVLRITARQAAVEILCIGNTMLFEPVQGVIRKEDVRAIDSSNVKMETEFVPEQLVRAVVRSIGDSRSYFLSTAQNGLGIIPNQAP